MTKTINLYASEGCWLYKSCPADVHRDFNPSATIPPDDEENWEQCTEQQRLEYEEQWAQSHPEVEPEQHDPLDVHWENPEEPFNTQL